MELSAKIEPPMSRRSGRAQSEPGVWTAPAFPRAVRSFAGRDTEIERIVSLVDTEVLFMIYGLGGVGKTELVYRVIEEISAKAPWTDVVPVLVDVRPDATITRALAELLAAVGAGPEPRRGHPTEASHLTEQLSALARLLDARPCLLFIDNVHHLPPDAVAEALKFLSRRVERGRIIIASRHEIPMPPDAPPPVVTTLGPLDRAAAEQMMDALAGRMDVPPPDPDDMFRETHGSPFHIRQMLVRHDADMDPLEESLRSLSPAARRVLLAATVAQQRLPLEVLRSTWSGGGSLDDALRELEQRFLIDLDQDVATVHDITREALMRQVAPNDVVDAHVESAELCLAQLRTSEPPALMYAVDAVSHYIAAGRHTAAWELVERWHSALAAAGHDHLLLEPLEQLREAMPARRVAIDLLIVRTLVRASMIEDADRVLSRVDSERSIAEDARFWALSAEIAQRRGELSRAEMLLERAAQRAPDEAGRFQVRLQLAYVAMFAGNSDRARQVLTAALAELPNPTARQHARCGWARAISWIFDERYEAAAEEAQRTRRELEGTTLGDLTNRLAMVETLAWIEADDMERARAAASLINEAGLRHRVASLYRAIAVYADGEPRAASKALLAAHEYLDRHGDAINAYLAGHFGASALAEIGRLGEAQILAERTAQVARRAGLRSLVPRSLAQQALLAAEAMQSSVAHRLASEALADQHTGPRTRARAHCAHSHAFTLEGDITRALEHVAFARAAVAGPDLDAAHAAIDSEQAAIELVGGNLERAVELAEQAVEYYRTRSRDYEEARALLVLGGAYLARARRTDLLFAEQTVAQSRELADRGELRAIQVGCAILAAGLARRANRERAADELLADALRKLDPERGSIYASTLMAAIEGGAVGRVVPGVIALLAHLGFADAVDCYLVDQHGRRAATTGDVTREQTVRELLVDEVRAVIIARRGEVEITGRPMQCALLSVLVQARGESVSPDTLYRRVWGVDEYHPLQHRNALYVAINRLRKMLRDVLPDREVVERASTGWRLADGIDACAAIAVREHAR